MEANPIYRRSLQLQCAGGELLAFIAGDMPQSMRASLEHNVIAALAHQSPEPVLQDVNSSQEETRFAAIHFSYYSRMSTKVS